MSELAVPAIPRALSPKSCLRYLLGKPISCVPRNKSARFLRSSREWDTFLSLCLFIFSINSSSSVLSRLRRLLPCVFRVDWLFYGKGSFKDFAFVIPFYLIISFSSLTARFVSLIECITTLKMMDENQKRWPRCSISCSFMWRKNYLQHFQYAYLLESEGVWICKWR